MKVGLRSLKVGKVGGGAVGGFAVGKVGGCGVGKVSRLAGMLAILLASGTVLGAPPQGRLSRLSRPFRPAIAEAQEPVKIRAMGDPRPGDEAPAFSLPYFTTEGPGPAEQPFTLRAELGRVVVLAFCRGLTDSTAVVLLRTLTARYDSLFPGQVAVAAVVPDAGPALVEASRANSLQIKLLADTAENVRRMFGVERNQSAVYIIGPTGRVVWRDLRFNPLLARGYGRIRREVDQAAGRSGLQ
jgi:peroxiredoxin